MEFEITGDLKRKAKKRRIKNEKKWLVLRVTSMVSLVIAIVAFVLGIFVVEYENESANLKCALLFSVGFMVFIVMRALIANMASHWIDDRLNERIWVENGYMYHFIQTSFAAGLNSRSADRRATVYEINLRSIMNAKYDPKSGRIEFNAIGRGVDYADYMTQRIEQQWELPPQFTGIFYDYTDPGLYDYLKGIGVKFTLQTIDFKISDGRI